MKSIEATGREHKTGGLRCKCHEYTVGLILVSSALLERAKDGDGILPVGTFARFFC